MDSITMITMQRRIGELVFSHRHLSQVPCLERIAQEHTLSLSDSRILERTLVHAHTHSHNLTYCLIEAGRIRTNWSTHTTLLCILAALQLSRRIITMPRTMLGRSTRTT